MELIYWLRSWNWKYQVSKADDQSLLGNGNANKAVGTGGKQEIRLIHLLDGEDLLFSTSSHFHGRLWNSVACYETV